MKLKIAGKSVLVTGSSKGIGYAIAERLHEEGCRVALNGRNLDLLKQATSNLTGSLAVVGDVSDSKQARKIVSEVKENFGELDILVCNVGSGLSVPPGSETYEEWQRVFSTNLWSATNTVEAASKYLSDTSGSIICISSICGLEMIPGAPVTYSAAKAALHAYVRGISRHLGKSGVRINAIAPGNILFDSSVWKKKIYEDRDAVEAMLQSEVALQRLGDPEEIANLVVYLASPLSRFVTGQVWALDGGQVRS